MLYLTCPVISSVDLAHYRVSRALDWVSVDCGTIANVRLSSFQSNVRRSEFYKNRFESTLVILKITPILIIVLVLIKWSSLVL